MPRTLHIYVYDALDNPYGFSIAVQPEIDCTIFHSFFSWNVWKKKKVFKIFKSWQVCDWLAKWIIMLGFMDLRWPRVFLRSSVGLVQIFFFFFFIQSVICYYLFHCDSMMLCCQFNKKLDELDFGFGNCRLNSTLDINLMMLSILKILFYLMFKKKIY